MAFHFHDGLDPAPFSEFVRDTLRDFGGQASAAGQYLGVDPKTVNRWAKGLNSDGNPMEAIREFHVDKVCTRIGMSMALLYPQFEEAVANDRYCHHCEEWTLTGEDLVCPWCETTTYGREGRRPGRQLSVPEGVLAQVRTLYDQGETFAELARRFFDQTTYASRYTMAMSLARIFRKRGWPVRDTRDVARETRRKAAVGPRCDHVFGWGKHKGEKCTAAKLGGTDWCFNHDPARIERRVNEMRVKNGLEPVAYQERRLEREMAA